jgi:hypothetical protein
MNEMNKFKPFIGGTVTTSTPGYSEPISFDLIKPNGFGSIHFKCAGSGTATISIEVSNDDNPADTSDSTALGWTVPLTGSQIATGIEAGTYFYTAKEFVFPPCKWIRFKVEATTDSITGVILKPVIQ